MGAGLTASCASLRRPAMPCTAFMCHSKPWLLDLMKRPQRAHPTKPTSDLSSQCRFGVRSSDPLTPGATAAKDRHPAGNVRAVCASAVGMASMMSCASSTRVTVFSTPNSDVMTAIFSPPVAAPPPPEAACNGLGVLLRKACQNAWVATVDSRGGPPFFCCEARTDLRTAPHTGPPNDSIARRERTHAHLLGNNKGGRTIKKHCYAPQTLHHSPTVTYPAANCAPAGQTCISAACSSASIAAASPAPALLLLLAAVSGDACATSVALRRADLALALVRAGQLNMMSLRMMILCLCARGASTFKATYVGTNVWFL